MSLLRSLFGPSRAEVWRLLSEQVGGQFIEGGFFGRSKVRVRVGEWTVTLDTYTVSTGKHSQTFTRLRAPYVNRDGFRFEIYRKGFFSGLGKKFGMQDVTVGQPAFDDAFIIKGTDEHKLRKLFENRTLRELIESQPAIHLMVRDDEGWFGPEFPRGVDELRFQTRGVIKEIERLKELFDLFAETLHHLCHIGSAYKDDPKLELK